jgi:hypothetical protein
LGTLHSYSPLHAFGQYWGSDFENLN